jgi:hypothetical protein
MLRTNLSTRPFYNERLVRVVLGLITLVAIGLAGYNVVRIVALRSQGAEARGQADAATREANRLRGEAQQTINREQLAAVQTAHVESADRPARLLVDRAVQPVRHLPLMFASPRSPANRHVRAHAGVFGAQGRGLDAFIDALEKTGAFREVLSRQEEAQEDGTLRSVIQGYYRATAAAPAQADAPAPTPPPTTPPTEARVEAAR